jgi:hypothetical protein
MNPNKAFAVCYVEDMRDVEQRYDPLATDVKCMNCGKIQSLPQCEGKACVSCGESFYEERLYDKR